MTREVLAKLGWCLLGGSAGAWLASINIRVVSGHKVRWPVEATAAIVCVVAFWGTTR